MFNFSGIDLPDYADSPEVALWCQANIQPETIFTACAPFTWPKSLTGTPLLDPTPWPFRPVVINTWYWPWGASRFSKAFFVVNDAKLNQIRKVTEPLGVGKPATLTVYDGNETVTAAMYMLPALPLSTAIPTTATQTGAGVWLLTLVDERYWWWDSLLAYTVDGRTTTWANIYTAVGAVLGPTISVDPIPAAYGIPTADYTIQDRPLPPYLDAVAFSVGQRIVRGLDGTVKAQNWSTAAANSASQSLLYTKYAGGQLALTPG